MRKFLSVTLVAALTAMTAGCECFDCFREFEACKNQQLFGTPNPLNPYASGYQYGGGCAGVADCAGVVVQSPVMSNCGPSGCGPSGCGPAGCGVAPGMMVAPPQSYMVPGQGQVITQGQVIMPSPTVVPGPETYAPMIQQ